MFLCVHSSTLPHTHTRRLLNYEGSLMAFAGKSDKKENVTAAIAANIWMTHERGARTALPDETLNYIVLDCLVSKRNAFSALHGVYYASVLSSKESWP